MENRKSDEKQHDNVLDEKRDASKSLASEKVGNELKLEMSDIAIGVAESSAVAAGVSSRKSSCFKDADDLLNDIDDITYGTATSVAKRKSSDNVVKKKKKQVKVSKVKLDDDYHIGFATTAEVTDAHNGASARDISDIPLRLPPIISHFPKVGAQKTEFNDAKLDKKVENLTQPKVGAKKPDVNDAKLDKKAEDLTRPIVSNLPKVGAQNQEFDDAKLDKKVEDLSGPMVSNFQKDGAQKQEVGNANLDKKAEDLTHVLQHIKYQADDIDTFAQKKQKNDYTARKLGSVVISVPSAAMVTPGNREASDALPGEVMEFSERYTTRNVVITNTTEIDNGVVRVIQEEKPQKKPNLFKELFCCCLRADSKEQKEELIATSKQLKQHAVTGVNMLKSKTDVKPVMKQAKKEANKSKDTTGKSKAKKKNSKVGCSKVHVIGSEVKIDNGFLHFEPFGERRDNCFRRLWRRITGRG